jgi:hypothetical protein
VRSAEFRTLKIHKGKHHIWAWIRETMSLWTAAWEERLRTLGWREGKEISYKVCLHMSWGRVATRKRR